MFLGIVSSDTASYTSTIHSTIWESFVHPVTPKYHRYILMFTKIFLVKLVYTLLRYYQHFIMLKKSPLSTNNNCICIFSVFCKIPFCSVLGFTTGQAPPRQSSSAPPRWWCAGWSAGTSGHTRSLEPCCDRDMAACPAAAPRSSNTPATAPLTGRDAAALTWKCRSGEGNKRQEQFV